MSSQGVGANRIGVRSKRPRGARPFQPQPQPFLYLTVEPGERKVGQKKGRPFRSEPSPREGD